MTIDEAIRQLSRLAEMSTNGLLPSERDACRLSIEALKRAKVRFNYTIDLLPGETEESSG